MKVWALLGAKAGDKQQVLALAESLGLPHERRQLVFNALHHLPNWLLGAGLGSVDRRRSDALAPPWPDLVISAGKRSVPAARWIARQSGGRTRLAHIGRPWTRFDHFDLIVTTPQYRLPPHPRVLEIAMPMHPITAERLARGNDPRWKRLIESLPAPRLAVLVGGSSTSHVLTADAGRRLGQQASAWAAERAGSLLVTTSPRTPARAIEALREAVRVPAHVHVWNGPEDNPYDAFLATADAFAVTGDSASMVAEAIARGKPVMILPLPRRISLVPGAAALADGAQRLLQRGVAGRAYRGLVRRGFVTPPRDLGAYHDGLETANLATRFGSTAPGHPATPANGLAEASRRTLALLSER